MVKLCVFCVGLLLASLGACLELWEPNESPLVMLRPKRALEAPLSRKAIQRRSSPAPAAPQQCGSTASNVHIPSEDYALQNETNRAIEIKWVGSERQGVLALTTQANSLITPFGQIKIMKPSRLWRWDEKSKQFLNITKDIGGETILDQGGLLQSPTDPDYVLLIVYNRKRIHVSYDGGMKWTGVDLKFTIHEVKFHPTNKNYLLAHSIEKKLAVSSVFGKDWQIISENVNQYYWDPTDSKDGVYHVYASHEESGSLNAYRFSLDKGKPPTVTQTKKIYSGMYRFLVSGKFLMISSSQDGAKIPALRGLNISEDRGNTWNRGKLPESATADIYSILDATEGLIIVHVGKAGSTTGTLYASDGSGAYFNPVLTRHVYSAGVTDFYKVTSIRGTYITTIAGDDGIVQSMISFDRGGHWQAINADPEECRKNNIVKSDECRLHFHHTYSASQGVKFSQGILSSPNAKGLIIAHGNLGKGLKYTDIGVYVTQDGGYNWKKILDGPHRYQMADSGNLITAIPDKGGKADTVYYSMDWGACWHTTSFTLSNDFHLTGLLIEPSLTSLSTSIWGYLEHDNMWRVVFVDFSIPADRQCTPEDYDTYVPHMVGDKTGCVFGTVEKFYRRKKDRVCYNAKNFAPLASSTSCFCTAEDFECDYGYQWNSKFTDCVKDKDFHVSRSMYCNKPGQLVYNQTFGYRLVPGDKCKGGVITQYISTKMASCSEPRPTGKPGNPGSTNGNKKSVSKGGGNGGKVAAGILIPLALLALGIGGFLFYRKCYQRGGERKYDYKYSMLAQDEEGKANLLDDLGEDEDD
eukprot:m.13743 g.13743  ORF g.13743 m.13743 type:complete len:807 (+) comp25186_c0_seq4:55-2475(+)